MTNEDWHLKNPIPKNATGDERIKWHLENAKRCGCCEIPPKLLDKIRKN